MINEIYPTRVRAYTLGWNVNGELTVIPVLERLTNIAPKEDTPCLRMIPEHPSDAGLTRKTILLRVDDLFEEKDHSFLKDATWYVHEGLIYSASLNGAVDAKLEVLSRVNKG